MKRFSTLFRAGLLILLLLLIFPLLIFPPLIFPALILPLLILPHFAAAQEAPQASKPLPPAAYKLVAVEVKGSVRFTPAEVALASGLPVGTIAHEEDFKKAARQLGESGAFGSISYSYTYSSAGTKLVFAVSDAEKFVPARFTDFVWFSDDDLRQKLHERIPLFKGDLPATGRLPDQVSDVLQALLVEGAIPGHVEFLRNSKDEQLQSIDYSITGISIRIRRVDFPGASASELPQLQAASERLRDREYSRAEMQKFIEHTLLATYREHGYLKAACAAPQPKVVKTLPLNSLPDEGRIPPTFVDVAFPVTPGMPYKLARVEWSGNKEISTDILQKLLHGTPGQTADTVQLEDDLRAVQDVYGTRGYVTTTIKADAEFDDAAGTVAYHLAVTEGPVYRMGELAFRGIDNSLEAKLRSAWKLRPGDVYDAAYLKRYLPVARRLLPATLDWDVSTHVTALSRDKTVDVDIQYTAKAPK